MSLNILIIGAGVCGPALATLLHGANHRHRITVIERSPSLRLAGQQIDLKDQGLPILKKMGLQEVVKSQCVKETGMEVVDAHGKAIASFGVAPAGDKKARRLALTNEYEIMRGDLVKILYEASLRQRSSLDEEHGKEGALKYVFGTSISALEQQDNEVNVTFSNGETGRFDLVVGADGQGSRTRRLAFGQEASDNSFKSIGIHAAYYTVPKGGNDGGLAQMYSAPRSRFIMTRNSNRPTTQAYLFTMDGTPMKDSYKLPVEEQKNIWKSAFQDAGWESPRLLGGMDDCDDFYAYEIGQVHMKSLYTGRVVLLGDAGYCPSPFTGLGTTLSLIGSYLLAGELARQDGNVDAALESYERLARPPIDECQKMPSSFGMFFPSSSLGVWVLRNIMWAVSKFRLHALASMWQSDDSDGWKIPDYPELNLPM
ncbi:FAD/NAD(P)-binding domain-containing protein [Aaosphaeria arxii CBS 175.79]|uniref:FAD/NAD(P)-binding domain-containing protein n=1 Tax=Aaosphaeria arxii CBS 175.79 TaxID=1450172 RepID=A0A6A5XWU3_9PLEO|nr:FAD/NAD(P)-binding domain-containing protein [Aaosphaeria arxii CBS 175.79]KAF2017373.1 FAD/NAD(P)-binding domain-containing protein [Aaosphaeria arxii CBS 175.79]